MHESDERRRGCPICSRRDFFRIGLSAAAVGAAALWLPGTVAAEGSTDPFPIPWLDRNGSHNQAPGPGQDLSSIFQFRGQVARCNDFTGMGTTGDGQRLPFGGPTTDFSFMQGEFVAPNSKTYQGTFAHI
ncbi:MAG: hypothetical protein NVS4B8_09610 [Herpetosiphon sp.]